MHWVLIYFLAQANVGGVGQIRFKTEKDCQQFYQQLEHKYKSKHVEAKGICMEWPHKRVTNNLFANKLWQK